MVNSSFQNLLSLFGSRKKIPVTKEKQTFIVKGSSGTEIYAGQYQEEYLQKLCDQQGIKAFDEMRRSDPQVAMLLRVVKNPIRSASFEVLPAGEEEKFYEQADFIKHIFFNDISSANGLKTKTFREFIQEALTMIEYGFVAFEVVHKPVKNHKIWGDYLGIADLGFRHQRSIIEWILAEDGTLAAVRQMVHGDLQKDVLIPGQHILTFALDKEGDSYQGISMLRPCYGSWYRKNLYRKLQGIGIERAAKGIPVGKVTPEFINRPDYATQLIAFQDLIDKLAAHEKNGIVLPAGADITQLKLTHDSEKVQSVIDSENVEMSKSFLANFMELGLSGSGGSYALGQDLSQIFLSGIQYIADMICEGLNKKIIPDLIKAKFGEQDIYPKFYATGINDKAGKELSEIISTLLDKKALQASTRLQRHLHKLYRLPDLDEDIAAKDDEAFLNPPTTPTAPADPADPSPQDQGGKQLKKKVKLNEPCCGAHKLSDAQKKDFPASALIEQKAEELNKIMRDALGDRSKKFLQDVSRILNGNSKNKRDAVLSLKMPDAQKYQNTIRAWAINTIDDTTEAALKEIGLPPDSVTLAEKKKKVFPQSLKQKLLAQILLTVLYQDTDIEKAVFFAFNEEFETLSNDNLMEAIERQVDAYLDKSLIETAAVNLASGVVNTTRRETFLSPEVSQEIESFVFMNADPVSKICKALNGKVFSKEEFETSALTPPLHHNCKSYIRAQTAGKAGNLPITGLKIDGTPQQIAEIMRTKTL